MEKSWIQALTNWFLANQRHMPWRDNPLPYHVWISEIMLQQTQVVTVIPYFNAFIKKFPSIEALAKAPLDTVLKSWEGLGYYSRARNLHEAANYLTNNLNGNLPLTYKELLTIKGIGSYTAAAIASICYGEKVPVVDGNVLRVFSRFWDFDDDILKQKTKNMLFERLTPFMNEAPPLLINQGMMELGALICKPKNPLCSECPLTNDCLALKNNTIAARPVKKKQKPAPHYDIGVGIIVDGNKILIAKRKTDQMLGGLWEFPGGKKEEGEDIVDTIKREMKEEIDLDIEVNDLCCTVKHAFSHFKITLHAYYCTKIGGKEKAISPETVKWVDIKKLKNFAFPTANKKILFNIQTKLAAHMIFSS